MKLSRYSGSEPQSAEDRIGSGALRLANDPVLHLGQTRGRLVDVVAVDIGNGFEQLLDPFVPLAGRFGNWRLGGASRHQRNRARSIALSHPIAFPLGVSASIAETSSASYADSSPAG